MKQKNILKIVVMLAVLLSVSCKTRHVTTDKTQVEQVQSYDQLVLADYLQRNQSTKELNEAEINELKEFISSLNISYDGKDINDKLDVLLKKTADGATQLTLQGKGTANYSENNKEQIALLEKRLFARQDSIEKARVKHLEQFKSDLFAEIKAQNKQVDSSGLTFGTWVAVIVTIIIMLCLTWLKKQFKRPLKMV